MGSTISMFSEYTHNTIIMYGITFSIMVYAIIKNNSKTLQFTNVKKLTNGYELNEYKKQQRNLTIHWVRHAQSSGNKTRENIFNIFSFIKGAVHYQPILTYTGLQQAILLGKNFIKKHNDNDNDNDYDVVFSSPTFRTIFTAIMTLRGTNKIIYVVPFINEVNNNSVYDYQNSPVPLHILKNCVLFFKDWLEHNWITNFDDIELIEKLNEIKQYYNNDKSNGIVIIINTILKFKQNNNNKEFNVKANIKHLLLLLSDNKELDMQILKNVLNPEFLRGPEVDFSIYEYYEKHHRSIINFPSFDTFYNIILPKAYKTQIVPNKTDIKMICFTHGSLMWNKLNKITHPVNTGVIEEIRNNHSEQKAIKCIYEPDKNKKEYEKVEQLEKLNDDICRTEGLKGILNMAIWNNNDRGIIPNQAMLHCSFVYEPIDYADDNVKFYFENRDKYHK